VRKPTECPPNDALLQNKFPNAANDFRMRQDDCCRKSLSAAKTIRIFADMHMP